LDQKKVRLGDVVDDYCSRCRLLMNHGVMAIDGESVKKVRCNTCMNEHPYRGGKLPKRRKDPLADAYAAILGKLPKAGGTGPGHHGGGGSGGGPHVPLAPEDSADEPEDE